MFDLAIIGAGPGGYVAAIRAGQLGAKVALVEKESVGGVCLNRGCIPTKAIAACAEKFAGIKRAGEFGIVLPQENVRLNYEGVKGRKDSILKGLKTGIEALLKGNRIDLIKGSASFKGPSVIAVNGNELAAKNIMIATGSKWIEFPDIKKDGKFIVTSDEALEWTELPESIAIIGGGVVGCEFASFLNIFGSKVTIIEATSSILPPVEKSVSRLLARSMKQRGVEILTDTTVASAGIENGLVVYALSNGEKRQVSKMMVAAGRRPNTSGLGLETAKIALDENGFVKVDKRFKTNAKGVFAIGDVIGNPMLAHAASFEATLAVRGIFDRPMDYEAIYCPSPIFTHPEVASVGFTSEELSSHGLEFKAGRFPFAACGKAVCDGETEGQAIIHSDGSGRVLGAHIIGENATVLIAEIALAMRHSLSVHDISQTIHSHPTLSEIVAEAAEDVFGTAVHVLKHRVS